MADPLDIAIVGAGGHAKETYWTIRRVSAQMRQPWRVLCFVEREGRSGQLFGLPVLPESILADHPGIALACAIGTSRLRREVATRIEQTYDVCWPVLIDPTAVVHPDSGDAHDFGVTLGEGTIIYAGAIITVATILGRHVHVNRAATIGHDSAIGDFVSLCPRVVVSGNVRIGDTTFVGANATIVNGVTVGRGCTIGAQACVVKDIVADQTAYGVPARTGQKSGDVPR